MKKQKNQKELIPTGKIPWEEIQDIYDGKEGKDFNKLKILDQREIKLDKRSFFNGYNIVIDIETTGLKPYAERITEIVALKYTNDTFKYMEPAYNNLLNPLKKIPEPIKKLTGITDEMVMYKPYQKEALKILLKNINLDSDILIAHNAKFEYEWLTHFESGFKLVSWICTRAIYLYMKDGNTYQNNWTKNYSKLKNVCQYFDIEYNEKEAHRAQYDVTRTSLVAKEMIKIIGIKKCIEISEKFIAGKGYGKRKIKQKEISNVDY